MTARANLRWAGRSFQLSATLGVIHCGSVLGFGAFVFAWRNGMQFDYGPLSQLHLFGIGTIAATSMVLGVGLLTLSRLSVGRVDSTNQDQEEGPAGVPSWHAASRAARAAALLSFSSAGVGLVAIGFIFGGVGADGLDGVLALMHLWFLGFASLTLAGVFGGDLVKNHLAEVRVYEDPLHLFRWYAGLTAVFTNGLLLWPIFYYWNGLLITIPFGVVPLLGIVAFAKIFRTGSLFVRRDRDLPASTFGTPASAGPRR